MAIPLTFLNRVAIPLVVAALYLNKDGSTGVDLSEQALLFDKTMRLSDQVLSHAKGELEVEGEPEEFDYIVVGGGSAGAVIVNGIASHSTVLLLEAGGDPNSVLDIPFAHDVFWSARIMDWNYTTVQQTRACLYNLNGYCSWPRGKALGGTSSINIMLYNRCRPKDYDLWANFTGDASWSWENIKDIYNRLEDYHGLYENEDNVNNTHGSNGNVYVGKVDYLPGLDILKDALQEKGIPTGDLDGGEFNYGFSTVDYSIKDGMRWGAYQSHLQMALDKQNMLIRRYALVTKILFNGTRAIGVDYERHGQKGLKAFARKEVILSAGVMESPKLLMLSGIGPKEHLDYLNITTLVDLPAVGEHLQDHPGVDILGENGMGFLLNTTLGTFLNNSQFVLQFLENGTGPLNSYSRSPRLMKGYLNSSFNIDKDWPEVYIYVYERFHGNQNPPLEEIYFTVHLARSSTEGSIKLVSNDPEDKPSIDPNFFHDPTDVEKLVDVIQVMMNLFMNSTAYEKYGIQMLSPFETCKADNEFLSREYWKCYVYQMTTPRFHTTSTCRMGPNNTVAVVDSQLR